MMDVVVLSGGVALGAYQGGALEELVRRKVEPAWLACTSVGAVNGALYAGNPPGRRIDRIRAYWDAATFTPPMPRAPAQWWPGVAMLDKAHGLAGALQVHLLGNPGLFHPRIPPQGSPGSVASVYDNAPLARLLRELIDFDRLNSGEVRFSLATVDIITGEEVSFDTAKGDRIEPDHLLATSGFIQDFAPVTIDGRLLGDGGFRRNAPLHHVFGDAKSRNTDVRCFVVDLFSPDGAKPTSLSASAERRIDLIFGGQSLNVLREAAEQHRLRRLLARMAEATGDEAAAAEGSSRSMSVLYLSYRADLHEAGPEKMFDFSRSSLKKRWSAGQADIELALLLDTPARAGEFKLVQVRRPELDGQ
jgi:NTE family protein